MLATTPLASAAWRSWLAEGNPEPSFGSTGRGDRDVDVMFPFANNGDGDAPAVGDRIYFDAVAARWVHPPVPSANPEGTAMRNYVVSFGYGFLGYWRDCNHDGFMGDALTGALVYPAGPGVDDAVCPPGSLYRTDAQAVEFLSIGPGTRDLAPGATETSLCPDRNGGPSGSKLATPRADAARGALEGGNNVMCVGGDGHSVQDDYAKVWHDWGLATDTPTTIPLDQFPFPDGTMRDSNGAFRYADVLTYGVISRSLPGLWPARYGHGDPARGAQCAATHDVAAPGATIANALDAVGSGLACSPVPNVAYATVPLLGPVAWPGHLIERRVNDSESAADPGTPITRPFAPDCSLRDDPDAWDDEAGDGDPLVGGGTQDASAFLESYMGPGESGPSVEPTVARAWHPLLFNVGAAGACGDGGQPPRNEHPLELDEVASFSAKVAADAVYSYVQDTRFNPAEAPGGPAPDAVGCVPSSSALFGSGLRCGGGHWLAGEQWVGTHGVTELDPRPQETWLVTFYADVSLGDGSGRDDSVPGAFDAAGDGPFDPIAHGVWDRPAGLATAAFTVLPARVNDAHQYGDEQCDAVTLLTAAPGGHDRSTVGTVTAVASPGWSCDRNVWATAAALDCTQTSAELACYRIAMVGDPYDLRDIDCYDNDVAGAGTTDASGPLPAGGLFDSGLLAPGFDCDAVDPARLPDL